MWHSTFKKKISLWEPPMYLTSSSKYEMTVSLAHTCLRYTGSFSLWLKTFTWWSSNKKEKTHTVSCLLFVCLFVCLCAFLVFYLIKVIRIYACANEGTDPWICLLKTSLTWTLFSLQSTCLLTDWKLLKLNRLDCWIMHNHCVGLTLQCPVRQQRASTEAKRPSLPRGQWFYTHWKQHRWRRKLVLPILFIKMLHPSMLTHTGEKCWELFELYHQYQATWFFFSLEEEGGGMNFDMEVFTSSPCWHVLGFSWSLFPDCEHHSWNGERCWLPGELRHSCLPWGWDSIRQTLPPHC